MDVRRLRTLGTLGDVEAHPLVLIEAAVAVGGDGREVREHIRTAPVWRNEAESLFSVEPFDSADSHDHSLARLKMSTSCGPMSPCDHPRPKTQARPGSNPHQALAKVCETKLQPDEPTTLSETPEQPALPVGALPVGLSA